MKIWLILSFLTIINVKVFAGNIIVPSNIQIQEDYYESLLNEYFYKNYKYWTNEKLTQFYYPNLKKVKMLDA